MKKLILCMLVVAAAACMTVMGEVANLDVSLTVNPSFTIAWKADNNDAPGEDISSADMNNDGSGDYSASVWIEGSTNIVNAVDIFISGDEYLSATINDTVYTIPYSISHDATASATSSFTPQVGDDIKHSFQIARPDGTGADGNYVWDFSSRVKISATADDVSKVPVASTGTTYTANLTATVQSAH